MAEPPDKKDHPEQQRSDPVPVADVSHAEPRKLTPEEQMALYEKELKEGDWGHQPC